MRGGDGETSASSELPMQVSIAPVTTGQRLPGTHYSRDITTAESNSAPRKKMYYFIIINNNNSKKAMIMQ